MANINEILNKIKQLDNTTQIKLFSNNQIVDIKQLSVKQQKDIRDLPKNVTLAMVQLNKTLNNIIKTNCNCDISNINIIDKILILLVFKSHISETYKDVNIKNIIDYISHKSYNIESKNIITKNFKFTTNIPSLKRDNEINNFILKNYNDKSVSIKNESELEILATQTYNNVVVAEICKFIDDIIILENENEIQTDWKLLSPTQQLTLLENIPYSEIKDVIEYIEYIRDIEKDFLTFENNKQKMQIEINFDFFNK